MEMTLHYAQFQHILSPYHQRLHPEVIPLAALEDLHKESIPPFLSDKIFQLVAAGLTNEVEDH